MYNSHFIPRQFGLLNSDVELQFDQIVQVPSQMRFPTRTHWNTTQFQFKTILGEICSPGLEYYPLEFTSEKLSH